MYGAHVLSINVLLPTWGWAGMLNVMQKLNLIQTKLWSGLEKEGCNSNMCCSTFYSARVCSHTLLWLTKLSQHKPSSYQPKSWNSTSFTHVCKYVWLWFFCRHYQKILIITTMIVGVLALGNVLWAPKSVFAKKVKCPIKFWDWTNDIDSQLW